MRKKGIIIMALFATFALISASLIFRTQSTYETFRNSKNQQSVVNPYSEGKIEKAQQQNGEKTSEDQNIKTNDPQATDTLRNDAPEVNEKNSESASTTEYSPPELPLPLPDGRIFLGSEPPYGYTPTCSPKERTRIPITPLDLGS